MFYAFIFHPLLPIKNSRGGNLLKALIFAGILATLSAIWWVPQLFNQVFQTALGWFSQNLGTLLGTDAWKPIVGIYPWHVIYGG